nr:MASE1 domain-containing protein [uncultured Sphingomonas sp.]
MVNSFLGVSEPNSSASSDGAGGALIPPPAGDWGRWLLLLLAYGVGFTFLRWAAQLWETHGLFSLWFPAAGLRLAFLWWAGPRITPFAALSEALVSLAAGTVEFGPSVAVAILGVLGPCLVYGLVVYVAQSRLNRSASMPSKAPMTFAATALIGPVLACIAAMPWALPLSMQAGRLDSNLLFSSLLVFSLGDALGILILAPPLLWLAQGAPLRTIQTFSWQRLVEPGLVLPAIWALILLMKQLGYGLQLAPLILAAGWIGLRGGQTIAWLAILAISAVVLQVTTSADSDVERITGHMLLACILASAYLAGSLTDSQRIAAAEIKRRDKLLYHADRLRTLRAMSVAVIHEVAQPISTLSLEANGLLQTVDMPVLDRIEIGQAARIIHRQSQELTELIGRLRNFGERGAGGLGEVSAEQIVRDAVALVGGESRQLQVSVIVDAGPWILLQASEIELRQAFLNLIRNALAASGSLEKKEIRVGWEVVDHHIRFHVSNEFRSGNSQPAGMGVGLIIARAIARAHGGYVGISQPSPSEVVATLSIPRQATCA